MSNQVFTVNPNLKISTVTIAEHRLLILDDFLNDPESLKKYSLDKPFSPYPGYKERKGYPGIRAQAPSDYSYNITVFLEPLLKEFFDVPKELDIRKSVCAFSLMTLKPEELSPLQCTPHFDSSTPNHLAVLLYLCNEEHGGTAFYKHKSTGITQVTNDNRENYLDIYYEELNRERPAQAYFAESGKFFEKIGFIPARFNRLVAYKGSLLHNPYINPNKSIEKEPAIGRLTVNTFYDF